MKKAICIMTAFVMVLSCMFVPQMTAYAADISLKVSATSVEIGDSITATVSVPDNVTGTIDVTFSTDVLQFSKASADANINGKTISISIGKYGLAGSQSVTITFKAKTSGTAKIQAAGIELYDHDDLSDVSLGSASVSVAVANKTIEQPTESESEAVKSADNSLASLKLSAGKLSPTFKGSVTKYTATVDYDVKKVIVSAKANNANATIESVTGDGTVSLKVGENTIEIVVRAENGVKAVYRVVVTRKAQEVTPLPSESESQLPSESESQSPSESESQSPSESETQQPSESTNEELKSLLQWNGESLKLSESIPQDIIPVDFKAVEILVKNQEIPALSFEKGDLTLLYLLNTNGAGALYVYDDTQQTIYPFIKLTAEKSYVMVLLPEEYTVSEDFASCTLSIEGKGVINAYQAKHPQPADDVIDASDFYLIYCMSSKGASGWYLYDSVEATFQRYIAALHVQEDVETSVTDTEEDTSTGNTENAELVANYKKMLAELETAKTMQYIMMGAAGVLALAFIIVLMILVRKRKEDSDLDEFEIHDVEEEYEKIEDASTEESADFSLEKIAASQEENVQEEKMSEEMIQTEIEEDEIEIEFYEMPKETEVAEEDDEIEIEFYEMPEESIPEEIEEDDDGDLEFIELD